MSTSISLPSSSLRGFAVTTTACLLEEVENDRSCFEGDLRHLVGALKSPLLEFHGVCIGFEALNAGSKKEGIVSELL